jgi:hypothetical protein
LHNFGSLNFGESRAPGHAEDEVVVELIKLISTGLVAQVFQALQQAGARRNGVVAVHDGVKHE